MAEAPEIPVDEAPDPQENEASEEAPLSEFVQSILAPISSSNPCGEEAMFVDDYLTLRAEINRKDFFSSSIDGEKLVESGQKLRDRKNDEAKASISEEVGGPDFRMIAETGGKILQKQSKDLMVAGWMTYGLFHKNGTAGLSEGVTAIQKLAETFWDAIYPKSHKARKNAIEYLDNFNEPLKKRALQKKFVASDREHMERVSAGLQALQSLFTDKIEDRELRPSLHGLAQTVTNILRDLPKPAPPKPAPAAPPDAGTGGAEAVQASVDSGTAATSSTPARPAPAAQPAPVVAAMPDIAIDISGDVGASLVQAADAMRAAAAADPLPYRLMRLVRWGQLNELPKNDNGKTVFKAPPAQRRTALGNYQMMGDWDRLMQEAEGAFAEEPFHYWLDLQRYMARGTGAKYSRVAEAIELETLMLLNRLPELPTLFFNDGIPFANEDTKSWLADIQKKHGGGGDTEAADGGEGAAAIVDVLAQQYEAALQTLSASETGEPDLKGALDSLRANRHQDRGKKDVFRRELYQAMLCMEAGRLDVAQSILANLNNQIDRHVLSEWNPELALDVWSHLHRCYRGLAQQTGDQEYTGKARSVFERISLIDPGFALSLLDE